MRKGFLLLTMLYLLSSSVGCASLSSSTMDQKARLRERVEAAYKCLQERDYDKFMDLLEVAKTYDKGKRQKVMSQAEGFPIVIDFEVQEIKFNGDGAKVRVKEVILFGGKKEQRVHFDYWKYKDNDSRVSG